MRDYKPYDATGKTVYQQIVEQPNLVFEGALSTAQHSVHWPIWYRFMGDGSQWFHLMGRTKTACGDYRVPMIAYQWTVNPPFGRACPECCAVMAAEFAGMSTPEQRP